MAEHESPYAVGEDGYLCGGLTGGVVYDVFPVHGEGIWCWSARVEGDFPENGRYLARGQGHYLSASAARNAARNAARAWCAANIPNFD